jgi:phosphopantothenoylcysteine decarboxylase/phosphopantothenate--cysteine ligase
MSAAVADFRPDSIAPQKIKKTGEGENGMTLNMTRTTDILMEIKSQREQSGYPKLVVGFAAESENLLANAQSKLERKGLDLLVANDISANDAGFHSDNNRVVILDARGGQQPLDLASKTAVSEIIIDRAAALLTP